MHLFRKHSGLTLAILAACCCGFLMSGCSTTSKKRTSTHRTRKGGGYYKDDGPGDYIPPNLDKVPDAVPMVEKIASGPSKPYEVMGQTFTPMTSLSYYKEQGVGSWYGRKFHGLQTSSGETYDMFGMTAAHPILPIPSYARVTSLETGKKVIVKINDRGPFLSSRLIDLSYTAAYKLGYVKKGSGRVEVELLLPDEIERIRNGSTAEYTGTASTKPISAFKIDPSHKKTAPKTTTASSSSVSTAPVIPTAASGISGYYLQFGAYQDIGNAQVHQSRYSDAWETRYPQIKVVPVNGLYKLMAGPFSTKEEASLAQQEMQVKGINGFILKK